MPSACSLKDRASRSRSSAADKRSVSSRLTFLADLLWSLRSEPRWMQDNDCGLVCGEEPSLACGEIKRPLSDRSEGRPTVLDCCVGHFQKSGDLNAESCTSLSSSNRERGVCRPSAFATSCRHHWRDVESDRNQGAGSGPVRPSWSRCPVLCTLALMLQLMQQSLV